MKFKMRHLPALAFLVGGCLIYATLAAPSKPTSTSSSSAKSSRPRASKADLQMQQIQRNIEEAHAIASMKVQSKSNYDDKAASRADWLASSVRSVFKGPKGLSTGLVYAASLLIGAVATMAFYESPISPLPVPPLPDPPVGRFPPEHPVWPPPKKQSIKIPTLGHGHGHGGAAGDASQSYQSVIPPPQQYSGLGTGEAFSLPQQGSEHIQYLGQNHQQPQHQQGGGGGDPLAWSDSQQYHSFLSPGSVHQHPSGAFFSTDPQLQATNTLTHHLKNQGAFLGQHGHHHHGFGGLSHLHLPGMDLKRSDNQGGVPVQSQPKVHQVQRQKAAAAPLGHRSNSGPTSSTSEAKSSKISISEHGTY